MINKEFDCIRDSLPEEENLNTIAENAHVPEIKRKNHVIKEHAQVLISTFTFKTIPCQIIIELIQCVGI